MKSLYQKSFTSSIAIEKADEKFSFFLSLAVFFAVLTKENDKKIEQNGA